MITTPFSATSTAAEVIAGIDLTGRRAIVTGGASGIGVETARALASAGAEVTIAVRNPAAGAATVEDIVATTGNKLVYAAPLDLADRASIAAFVAGWDGPLHILVNNAGVMAAPLTRTADGWESQFATNHLGHFALATGLHRALAEAGRAGGSDQAGGSGRPGGTGGARVVSVSSVAHLMGGVDFDDIHFRRRAYDPWVAYGQSKSANILFGVEATKRWAGDGIAVNALMPGSIRTNLQRHVTADEIARIRSSSGAPAAWKTPEQGAATSILVATSPLLDGVSGRYFEDCAEAGPHQPGIRKGYAAWAVDPEAAARLWDVSVAALAG